MKLITDSDGLSEACDSLARHDYVTVDTEFMREHTFWPELCLIQLAGPENAFVVDALAEGISLKPFFGLMGNESVTKVFHAARQDIEIVHHESGTIPSPLFDTQVAAMVCGHGDSISYERLVRRITGEAIDKSFRFTDWKRRPLSDEQIEYALADVTHLREVYRVLRDSLEGRNRTEWIKEEMQILSSPRTYDAPPEDAWRRFKVSGLKPRQFAALKALAQWREEKARKANVPRGRILKDAAIQALASRPPESLDDLAKVRGLPNGLAKSRFAEELVSLSRQAIRSASRSKQSNSEPRPSPENSDGALEMLKILLKIVSARHDVASRTIANSEELKAIAIDDGADVPAMKGWRRELFGDLALALKGGRIALVFSQDGPTLIEVNGEEPVADAMASQASASPASDSRTKNSRG